LATRRGHWVKACVFQGRMAMKACRCVLGEGRGLKIYFLGVRAYLLFIRKRLHLKERAIKQIVTFSMSTIQKSDVKKSAVNNVRFIYVLGKIWKKSDVFGELEKYLKLVMHSHFKTFIVKNQRTLKAKIKN
jgi:hypothetical protein